MIVNALLSGARQGAEGDDPPLPRSIMGRLLLIVQSQPDPGGQSVAAVIVTLAFLWVAGFFFGSVAIAGYEPPTPKRQRDRLYAGPRMTRSGPTDLPWMTHEPYRRKQCRTCHLPERAFVIEREGTELCKQCHEAFFDKLEQLAFIHGPLAVGQCKMCHNPHESPYPALTPAPQPELCRPCHELEALLLNPRHADKSERCDSCHNPHGGDARFQLREKDLSK